MKLQLPLIPFSFFIATLLCKAQDPTNDSGTIFSYDVSLNKETVVHNFLGRDGAYPLGSLTQSSNGLLYGLTHFGGANDSGTIFSYDIPQGNETVLYNFSGRNDGNLPDLTDLLEVDIPTNINQLPKAVNNILLYPNPSSAIIHLSLKLQQEQPVNLHLYNTIGQQVWAEDLGKIKEEETTIPVANLVNGIYVLIVDAGGTWQENEVVVVR